MTNEMIDLLLFLALSGVTLMSALYFVVKNETKVENHIRSLKIGTKVRITKGIMKGYEGIVEDYVPANYVNKIVHPHKFFVVLPAELRSVYCTHDYLEIV